MRAFRDAGAGREVSIRSFFFSLAVLFGILAVASALLRPSAARAEPSSDKRLALLIANGTYPDANLPMPSAAKDADLFAGELQRYGFEVDVRKDLGKGELQEAISTFLNKITPGSVALLYFNGIGIQVAHQTFLVPVNAELWSETDVKRDGISMDTVLADMNRRGASVKIVVLDAARRNPFERRFRAYSAGLAGVDAPEGTLVMYATAPNKVGKDPGNDVSLFMSELIKELRTPDISAEEAMTHTRVGVSRASNGEQVPWVASSLIEPFFFAKSTEGAGASPPAPPPPPPKAVAKEPESPPAPAPKAPEPSSPPVKEAAKPPAPKPQPAPSSQPAPSPPASPPPSPSSAAGPKPSDKVPKEAEKPAQPPKNEAAAGKASSAPGFGPPKDLKPGTVFRDCPDCPEMVVVPSGTYEMGSGKTPYDRPVHKVTFARPFAVGVNEVTFAQWDLCLSEGGCKARPDNQGWGGDDRPVINISWYDASDFVAWLAKRVHKPYRMPSESEWEYAAHGGTTTPFSWGATLGTGQANCMDCGGTSKQTLPVRSFKPNGFGLYDMAGNAAEWVQDCWNMTYRKAPADGAAWMDGNCAQHGLRGGSFDSTSVYIKPTARFRYDADVKYWANGMRVVRELP